MTRIGARRYVLEQMRLDDLANATLARNIWPVKSEHNRVFLLYDIISS